MLKVLFVLKSVEYIDPMGIMLLSSLAKQAGHHTYLHVLSDGEMVDTLERVKPDVVAFSAKTGEHKYYLEANRAVKAFDKGIVTIEEVELDDGIWEVEGYGPDGHEIEMKVEAASGNIIKLERDD